MRAEEYATWAKPEFSGLRDRMRDVMRAYGMAEKWFAAIKDKVLVEMGMPFLSDAIHRLEHMIPEEVDGFGDALHELGLLLEYPATPELAEPLNNDLDKVFECCVQILDETSEALGRFEQEAAGGLTNALSLQAEELQVRISGMRTHLLDAWRMWDNGGMSRASFDSWCRRLFKGGGGA